MARYFFVRFKTLFFICVFVLIFSPGHGQGLDAPHDSGSDFPSGCVTCHDMTAYDHPNLIFDPGDEPADIDDTLYNNICWGCHNGTDAMDVLTHSSLNIGTNYGNWSVGCSVCHNQHTQAQPGGKFIREFVPLDKINITPPKSGNKKVDFASATDFAGGAPENYNGICEVCHTQTSHYQNDGSGYDQSHNAISTFNNPNLDAGNCSDCHNHQSGFRSSCKDCHGLPPTQNVAGDPNGPIRSVTASDPYPASGEVYLPIQPTGHLDVRTHDDHVYWGGYYNYPCETCHYGGMQKTMTPADAMVDKKIQIGFSGAAIGSDPVTAASVYHGEALANGYTYEGTNNTSIIMELVDEDAMRTCESIYCHSQGTSKDGPYNVAGVAPNMIPQWAGAWHRYCDSCHNAWPGYTSSTNPTKTSQPTIYFMNTNAHWAHINNFEEIGFAVTCTHCHRSSEGRMGTEIIPSIPNRFNHANKSINIKFRSPDDADYQQNWETQPFYKLTGPNKESDGPTYKGQDTTTLAGALIEPGNAGGVCTNLYCHSVGNLDQNVDADGDGIGEGELIALPGGGERYHSPVWSNDVADEVMCSSCHGSLTYDEVNGKAHPLYASGPAGSTTANSHPAHVEASQIHCQNCHFETVDQTPMPLGAMKTGTMKHLNRLEDVDFKILDGEEPAYNAAVGNKTCSSTYCHNIAPAPQWGATGTVNCGDCHAVDNQLAGSHGAHYDTGSNAADLTAGNASTATSYIFKCGTCHDPDNASYMGHSSGPADTSDPAAKQIAEVYFDNPTSGGNGGLGYMRNEGQSSDPNGFLYTDGGCNNTYCHSNGTTSADYTHTRRYWGTTAPPAVSGICAFCHGTGDNDDYLVSGSHLAHIDGSETMQNIYPSITYTWRNKINCIACHDDTVSDNTTVKDKTKHVNHEVNIAFNAPTDPDGIGQYVDATATDITTKQPGSPKGYCLNLYCHSQGTEAVAPYPAPNYAEPTWGMNSADFHHPDNPYNEECSGCHGSYDDAAEGGIATNAHQAHVSLSAVSGIGDTIGCSNCHRATTEGGMELNTPENHTNRFVEIKFEKWPEELRGINFDTDGPAGTGPTYAGQNTAGDNYLTDFAQVVPDTSTKYSCANLYCHSNGNLAANVDNIPEGGDGSGEGDLADPATAFKSIEWNPTTTISCDGCHGEPGKAHPTYANGGAATTTANSHVKHVESKNLNCTYCHASTIDTNIPPTAFTDWTGAHLNRLEDVTMRTIVGQAGTYNAEVGSKTCSNVYCHSIAQTTTGNILGPDTVDYKTPVWGATTNCSSCHAASPLSGSHIIHDSNGSHCFRCHYSVFEPSAICTPCHNPHSGIFEVTTDLHVNTHVNVNILDGAVEDGTYTGTPPPGDGYGFCQNTYCHSRGTSSDPASYTSAQAGGPQWGTTFVNSCEYCHDGDFPGPEFQMSTGSHYGHIVYDFMGTFFAQFDCVKCHDATVSDSRTIDTISNHVNKLVNVAFEPSSVLPNGGTATYAGSNSPMTKSPGSSYGVCTNTYCHSRGTSLTPPYPPPEETPAWGTPLTTDDIWAEGYTCNRCHGSSYTAFASNVLATGGHSAHINNPTINSPLIGDNWRIGCSGCHNATGRHNEIFETGIPLHINGKVNIKFEEHWWTPVMVADSPTFNGDDPITVAVGAEVDPGSFGAQCDNVYCHSIGNLDVSTDPDLDAYGEGTLVPVGDIDGDTNTDDYWPTAWNDTSTGCNYCHGNRSIIDPKAHPTYASGAAGSSTANSHVAHVEGENAGGGKNCTYCHFSPNLDASIPPTFYDGDHINRLEEVSFKPISGVSQDLYEAEGTRWCTNNYCHSNGTVLATGGYPNGTNDVYWGAANVTCDTCHNTTDATNNLGPDYVNGTPKVNSHAAHTGTYGCETCHFDTTNDGSTIADGTLHANAVYDVTPDTGSGITFIYTPSAVQDGSGGSCSSITVGCHGDRTWGVP